MNRLDKWVKNQNNKLIRQKRSISPKDKSKNNSILEDKAIISVQIEIEFDSEDEKNLTKSFT